MSKQQPPTSTSRPSAILTPSSTPSDTPQRTSSVSISSYRTDLQPSMDEKSKEQTTVLTTDGTEPDAALVPAEEPTTKTVSKKKSKCRKTKHKKKSKAVKKSHNKKAPRGDSDSDDSEQEVSDSDDDESDDTSSDEDLKRRKSKSKQSRKLKDRRRRKSKKHDSDTESSDSDSEDSEHSSESEAPRKRKKKSIKRAKKAVETETEDDATDAEDDKDVTTLEAQVRELMGRITELKTTPRSSRAKRRRSSTKSAKSVKIKSKKADSLEYKRVDQLWDSNIHNYKLKESAEDDEGEFAEYAFLVRRRFDWENKYDTTVIDIKSRQLRTVLQEIMKDCKSVSLEAEEPTIDPNLLFLYLEELRTHYKKTLKTRIKAEKKKKATKKLEQQKALCKTLVSYIDDDYAETKKTLYPLLEAGNITFDLLWALFKPNDIAITSCYGSWDEPRCYKIEYAMKYHTMTRGEWYCIEGRYLEYDGKGFGYGDFEVDVEAFKGPRKITSLASYPLHYHKDPEGIKKQIIERGQRFVAMEGMEYKFHNGLAFAKKKKQVLKININGRVMIDPATFRRVNANYPISLIKPKDTDDLFSDSEEDNDCSCCDQDSDNEDALGGHEERLENEDFADGKSPKYKYKWIEDDRGDPHFVAVEVDENGEAVRPEQLDTLENPELKKRTYTEEQLLLTSPVVLGFAFSEKLWLEFSLSGVRDITYNDEAFDSLVLEGDKKSTVRALVESHRFHAARTIDDVVQGKGRGLVFVLHGPPGTGKTLTAEGISELLRCPLYVVSAGELGTDPARLEQELQKILDIAHSWGALLLLDEADVFLEKREVHDIHRNALVSIFLRLLEYFQGILFLTTNRVETFDDAFQSRIQVALRYEELTPKAKKEVWKNFIGMVRKQEGAQVADLSDEDYTVLSRHRINGRQIKNMVRTAQALALNEGKKLTMSHIRRVLDVAESFDRDLKGGTGYIDAMRSYT
ncbi:related to AAA family ATPase [Lecanosticta acicola]|uniref:Related to AAA family ATPase n=1 Tax=Lecanosticta acicola TaxID=111012 RepID=A0AAI8YYT7_9PEZI|nr:related to AAA family ATPase [Lecanosticta acicola]